MNRQMRRHPVNPFLPVSPISKKRVVDTKRQNIYVAKKQQRKYRRAL